MEELIIAAVLALLAKKAKGAPPAAAAAAAAKGPQIPADALAKVANIVAVRLTSGTPIASAKIIDEVTKLLQGNPSLTAKLIVVYSGELQGDDVDQGEDGGRAG